jgi:hypothetical protein
VAGRGDDILVAGTGNDKLYGESGFDIADYSTYARKMSIAVGYRTSVTIDESGNIIPATVKNGTVAKDPVLVNGVWQYVDGRDELSGIDKAECWGCYEKRTVIRWRDLPN